MKKAITLLAFIAISATVLLAQTTGEETSTSFSWPEIISYVVNGLFLIFSPKLVGTFNKLGQFKELANDFVDAVSDQNLSHAEQRSISTKFKALLGK